jgi:hypothetical protein
MSAGGTMYQFKVKTKRYGEKTICIDDDDKKLLFTTDENGNDVSLFEWHIAKNHNAEKLYVFKYTGYGGLQAQTLSKFLTDGARVFFADDNWLNCCRSNFITRQEKYRKKDPLFELPESMKQENALYYNAIKDGKKAERHV